MTAIKMHIISLKLNIAGTKIPFRATSIRPLEYTAPTKIPRLATIIIVRTESLTFASIFAQISAIFVMILMLQTRSRRTTPRTVIYSGRSFWSFSTKLVLLLLLDLNQYATVFNSEHARTIFYWYCTHLSHVEIWYAQFDNLNIRDNISDESTRLNALRMSVTLVETELEVNLGAPV